MAKKRRFYCRTTQLLGSLHVTTPQSEEQIQQMYTDCDLHGNADMLKVVTGATSDEDSLRVHRVGAKQSKPYIGLCLGAAGSYSRVINKRFTPVTHKLLAIAAPGTTSTSSELLNSLICPFNNYLYFY